MTPRQYTILIIDDCSEDREMYCRYLSREAVFNYKIIESESGEQALEYLATIQVDLILLDYILPDFDGLKFIEELKKVKANKIPPMIMLTGEGNETIAVEAMKSGFKDYLVKGTVTAEALVTAIKNTLQQDYLQSLLTKKIKQQQLIAEIALRIRKSLDLGKILNTAVREVQILLNCDRVVIYCFAPDMTGDVVAESVKLGWKKSLGTKVADTCFQEQGAIKYERGETWAVNNIYDSRLSECHIKVLEEFQVKANAVVPILTTPSSLPCDHPTLWGLLIAHQCNDIREWETDEIELLDKLAVQLAIAIQQGELLSNLRKELSNREKLEAELARLVQVLEASEDYIGLSTIKGQTMWNNPRMQKAIGINKCNNLSQLSIADYHPAWAFNLIQEQGIPTAIAQGSWLGETALLTQEGQEIPVSQLILAHKSPAGKIEYISTAMRDLTQQKQAEQSLQQRATELEWLNKELVKITSLLKKRNQELDNFAYVTSHDLKAPLRAIANLAAWLSEDLEGQIPEENQQQLRLMQSRVKRMDGLIQGLLEYSRVGRKKTPIKTINVKDVIQEAINSLSIPPEFKIVVAPNMPTLITEVLSLQQVFSNLISNAIKYHPTNLGKITISVAEQAHFHEFGVSDDGLGIDPQYHDRIFTIFQTLQPRDTIESTGIGLSIVKKIVEGQGGKIRVESQLGEGASFYFTWRK
jgi:signal transduction histidine kinase/CheY-like chemotaxis protein